MSPLPEANVRPRLRHWLKINDPTDDERNYSVAAVSSRMTPDERGPQQTSGTTKRVVYSWSQLAVLGVTRYKSNALQKGN